MIIVSNFLYFKIMNIHEYQAKEVLAKHGVAVPKGIVVEKPR